MKPISDITDRLTELHDSSLKELFETIDSHKLALHDLVQQAQVELTALVGSRAADNPQVRGHHKWISLPFVVDTRHFYTSQKH